MKTVILAGGFATRLRPLTLTRPKPLLSLLGKPIIEYALSSLKKHGFTHVVLSLRNFSEMFISRYIKQSTLDMKIDYILEEEPLGDGGPIALYKTTKGLDEDLLVINGDVYSEIDFSELLDFHKDKRALLTMVSTKVENPQRYGVLEIDENWFLRRIIEKPDKPKSNLINAGIYIFSPDAIPNEVKRMSIARDIIPEILKKGKVAVYNYEGIWADIGLPQDYVKLNFELLKKWYPEGYIANDAEIDKRVKMKPPYFISSKVKIKDNSVVGPFSILEEGVKMGRFSIIESSIIMQNSIIGDASMIRNSILGSNCYIGSWCHIDRGVILGDGVLVSDKNVLIHDVIILPHKEINESITERKVVL